MKVFEKRFVEANVVVKEGPSGPADWTGKVEFANQWLQLSLCASTFCCPALKEIQGFWETDLYYLGLLFDTVQFDAEKFEGCSGLGRFSGVCSET